MTVGLTLLIPALVLTACGQGEPSPVSDAQPGRGTCATAPATPVPEPTAEATESFSVTQGTVWRSRSGVAVGVVNTGCEDGVASATISAWLDDAGASAEPGSTSAGGAVRPGDVIEVPGGELQVATVIHSGTRPGAAPGSGSGRIEGWYVPG